MKHTEKKKIPSITISVKPGAIKFKEPTKRASNMNMDAISDVTFTVTGLDTATLNKTALPQTTQTERRRHKSKKWRRRSSTAQSSKAPKE